MADKLNFYQINLNKCEVAQASLMVELMNLDNKQFICLIQEPHFYGLKPSSINRKNMQVLHGKGTIKHWPRAMIVASKDLKLSMIEALTSRDTTCINLHNSAEELIICSTHRVSGETLPLRIATKKRVMFSITLMHSSKETGFSFSKNVWT